MSDVVENGVNVISNADFMEQVTAVLDTARKEVVTCNKVATIIAVAISAIAMGAATAEMVQDFRIKRRIMAQAKKKEA